MSLPRLTGSIAAKLRIGERKNMGSNNIYRSNAENCLRMAQTALGDRDKPFWLNLAQSWLRLAEHAARGGELESREPPVGSGTH
jgi:hypothetical protein